MTQSVLKTKAIALIALVSLSAFISSFSKKGGEGFEIYIDSKLVLQQFGSQMKTVKDIQLDQHLAGDQLVVKYHHCGHVGKNRSIVIRDARNKTLKEWKFANTSASALATSEAAMACRVKDIISLQKSNPGKLGLYYFSNELPKGRLLANIISGELAKVR